MMHGEKEPPPREPQGDRAACERARERLRVVLASELVLADDRDLAAHVARCESCEREYRDRLIAATRAARAERPRESGVEAISESNVGASGELNVATPRPKVARSQTRPAPRPRSWKTALLPVGVLALVAQLAWIPRGDGKLVASLLAGRGTAGGRELDPEKRSEPLSRGDWIVTDHGSRVELTSDRARIELAEGTRVLVEDAAGCRLLFDVGRIDVIGACSIRGPFGLLEIGEGGARLEYDGDRLLVESTEADLVATDPEGIREIHAGERVALLAPRSR